MSSISRSHPSRSCIFCELDFANTSWWIACDQKETYRREGLEAAKIETGRAQRLKVISADFRRLSDAAAVRLNRMGDTLEETSKRLGRIEFAPEAQLRTGVIPTTKGEREHP